MSDPTEVPRGADLLTRDAVRAVLAELAGWSRDGGAIRATYTLRDFPTAVDLVVAVAAAAEAANHHPDIDIRWRRVTFRLTTHDAGGLTAADVTLARHIQALAVARGWTPA